MGRAARCVLGTNVERSTRQPITSRYLRKADAAKYLGIAERTLEKWMVRRVVPYRKIDRTVLFDPEELDAAVNRYRVAAVPGRFSHQVAKSGKFRSVSGGLGRVPAE